MANLSTFLEQLFHGGNVTVDPASKIEMDGEVDRVLIAADLVQRQTLAGEAPAFCLRTAKWAAMLYIQACGFVVHRDASPAAVTGALSQAPPLARSPSVDYSADLIFQYLPDLLNMARRISPDDPLVEALAAIAKAWPLSSPGCGIAECESLEPFWPHPSLRMLYLDRIFQRGDFARAREPKVQLAMAEILGAHPELSPRGAEFTRELELAK